MGDAACRGSDLVGFFVEDSFAALIISSQSEGQVTAACITVMFLLCISGCSILVCTACSYIAADLKSVSDVEKVFNVQLFTTALERSINARASHSCVAPLVDFVPLHRHSACLLDLDVSVSSTE